jgi:hypothetical protein
MLVLLLGITPPGINNSVEYAAYREADTALWYDSGNSQKSGRFQPERVAALNRITRQVYSGMGGSFAPDFPAKGHCQITSALRLIRLLSWSLLDPPGGGQTPRQ